MSTQEAPMKRAILAAAAVLALPGTALASDGPSKQDRSSAAQQCRAERGTTDATRAAFRTKYGKNHNGRNAFGKCVSKLARQNAQATGDDTQQRTDAAKSCDD